MKRRNLSPEHRSDSQLPARAEAPRPPRRSPSRYRKVEPGAEAHGTGRRLGSMGGRFWSVIGALGARWSQRNRLPSGKPHFALGSIAAALVGAFLATETAPRDAAAASANNDPSRYPYDPACEWGRLADGRGMLVRCLTRTEAQALMGEPPATPARSDATPGQNQGKPAEKPASAPDDKAAAPEEPPSANLRVKASLLPAVADTGKLPEAHTKLAAAKSRFEDCVRQNGGLGDRTAEVHVRFLVRERGRAEGVSVSKRRGVSEKAARCVADVVDRRAVGIPDEPMVGATIVVSFTSEGE